ncbi:MAG: transposase family protein [Promicromonosporaceae bacterium]|nr:transposase family protein [Promicromonosporaceae bacterium]
MSLAQTSELIARAWQVHAGRPPEDRYDFELGFGRAVTMVLDLVRHNLAQHVTADLHGISQPTVSRIYRYLLPILGQVTALDRSHLADVLERGIVLIDNRPVPTENRANTGKTKFNGKHRKQAPNIQVATQPPPHLSAQRLGACTVLAC